MARDPFGTPYTPPGMSPFGGMGGPPPKRPVPLSAWLWRFVAVSVLIGIAAALVVTIGSVVLTVVGA